MIIDINIDKYSYSCIFIIFYTKRYKIFDNKFMFYHIASIFYLKSIS